jgi:hypothetical protein
MIANKSSEKLEKFQYFGMTLTDQNFIHEQMNTLQTDHTENHNLNPMHCVCTFLSAVSFMGAALADRLAQDLAA